MGIPCNSLDYVGIRRIRHEFSVVRNGQANKRMVFLGIRKAYIWRLTALTKHRLHYINDFI